MEEEILEIIDEDLPEETNSSFWKILIVDDESEVHQSSKLLLKNFTFEDKPLTFFSAYSAAEAKQLMAKHPDIAIIFLDVVMEEDDAGLKLVEYIRQVLKNHSVRIILRTGQPGQAPEAEVILNYDINDYQTKVELTYEKLIYTVTTGLRSYRDFQKIRFFKKTNEASILIVEDNPVNLKLLVDFLSKKDYKVRPTAAAPGCLSAAPSWHRRQT